MAERGHTPTEADQQRAREALAGLLVEYSDTDGPVTSYTTGPADWDEDAVLNLAERFAEVRAEGRAKTQEMKDYGDRAVHKLNQARFDLREERAKRPDREQVRGVVDAEFWQEHPDAERLTSALLALEPDARDRAMQLNKQEEERG